MPVVNFTKRNYKLVEDGNDSLGKVPGYDEEAFQLGITFKAKVGNQELLPMKNREEQKDPFRSFRIVLVSV